MPAYRFCRPDTVPLLVEALQRCTEDRTRPPVTLESFRRDMRELDVWPSNSMVALEGGEPIAVLIGTKRKHEVLVHRLEVAPEARRRGHGSHLVTSLSHKLAVLGPPRLAVEVPEESPAARALFDHLGFTQEEVLADWRPTAEPERLAAVAAVAGTPALAEPADLLELLPAALAWERAPISLRQAAARLTAYRDGGEWALLDEETSPHRVLAASSGATPLLAGLGAARGGDLLLAGWAEGELPEDAAAILGLTATAHRRRRTADAEPA